MVSELCLNFKCKECPEHLKCFGCEHNYIMIKNEVSGVVYKCSKCGHKIRLEKDNVCNECTYKCKGRVQSTVNKEKGIYQICSDFRNNIEKD